MVRRRVSSTSSSDGIKRPDAALAPEALATVRFGIEFYLRSIRSMARTTGNDLGAAAVFNAMWSANASEITNSSLTHTYRELDDLPPDSLRRPITVLALSNSLHMPYETVRRHMRRLHQQGLCRLVPAKGWFVPAEALRRKEMLAEVTEAWPSLLRFIEELHSCGFDFSRYASRLPQTVASTPPHRPPRNIRPIVRVAMEFVLRCVETMDLLHDGDFIAGLVFARLLAVRHRDARLGLSAEPSDELGEPQAIGATAKELTLTRETVRRAMHRLVEAGRVDRVGDAGFVVSPVELRSDRNAWAVARIYQQVSRYLGELHKAGFDFGPYL